MFKEGDRVYLVRNDGSLSDILYKVVNVFDKHSCVIQREGPAPMGRTYAEVVWDTSLLRHTETIGD